MEEYVHLRDMLQKDFTQCKMKQMYQLQYIEINKGKLCSGMFNAHIMFLDTFKAHKCNNTLVQYFYDEEHLLKENNKQNKQLKMVGLLIFNNNVLKGSLDVVFTPENIIYDTTNNNKIFNNDDKLNNDSVSSSEEEEENYYAMKGQYSIIVSYEKNKIVHTKILKTISSLLGENIIYELIDILYEAVNFIN
jgi:hypothetical protein